ncbi:hypothetical protein SAMN02746041_00277 [Desulfacinum hydrothermale DSM 13146]|uniref:Uncharacterized protein n=1 Tax=Desulfacinum hydrothermale DSM 13146 TaxID=1121390 RepID=A0A1W1X0E7_9BACT|nr:hypothetical protein [Desulfacinum hydrothermale]SMC17313.1 hypothetical protein SAMN02746041_00277 [Desulfacinum hydrothermale DSM 13146]
MQDPKTPDQGLRRLVQRAAHPNPQVRETALLALFAPRDGGDWEHWSGVLEAALGMPLPALDRELITFLLDLLCWLEEDGSPTRGRAGKVGTWKRRFASRKDSLQGARGRARAVLRRLPGYLQSRPYPLSPLMAWGPPIPKPYRRPSSRRAWLRCLRLLGTRMGRQVPPPWSVVTLRDLASVWMRSPRVQLARFDRGRWLRVGRAMLYPITCPVRASCCPKIPPQPGFWSRSRRCVLDRLAERTAEELVAIRRLATAVSRKKRRVVLSLHNATLAACGGWAFESLGEQFPDPERGRQFYRRVWERVRRADGRSQEATEASIPQSLWRQWEKRLARPKVLFALWEAWGRSRLAPSDAAFLERYLHLFASLVNPQEFMDQAPTLPYAWPGWLAPHQRLSLPRLYGWWQGRRVLWPRGWTLLEAFLAEGRLWLQEGRVESLVLPWIDKFFISSRRDGDAGYLRALFSFLQGLEEPPVILFWEDTARSADPSLALALRKHWEPDQFLGFGVFGDGRWGRQDAESILGQIARPGCLYVLRPLDDTHHPMGLKEIFSSPSPNLDPYDSSWKDGIHALYAGTQVEPLLSLPTDADLLPAWIGWDRCRLPLGAFFRRRLRRLVLGRNRSRGPADPGRDHVWGLYARWANLL